jgi:hypothetical protein
MENDEYEVMPHDYAPDYEAFWVFAIEQCAAQIGVSAEDLNAEVIEQIEIHTNNIRKTVVLYHQQVFDVRN